MIIQTQEGSTLKLVSQGNTIFWNEDPSNWEALAEAFRSSVIPADTTGWSYFGEGLDGPIPTAPPFEIFTVEGILLATYEG